MDRRSFIAALASASLIPAKAAHAARPVRVGSLLPLTGGDAGRGRMLHQAASLAVDEANRRLTRPLALVTMDTGSTARGFLDGLRRLLGSERTDCVAGPVPPPARAEALALVERAGGLLLDPCAYEGGECSKHVIHCGPTPHQMLRPFVPWLVREAGPRMVVVAGEGPLARTLARLTWAMLGPAGGESVGEVVGPSDPAATIGLIRAEMPHVVFSTLTGPSAARFHRQLRRSGVDPADVPVANPLLDEYEAAVLGPAAEGTLAVSPYFMADPTPANQRFLDNLRRWTGRGVVVDATAEASWLQIHLLAEALHNLSEGDVSPINLREAAKERQIVAPQGLVRLESDTLHLHLWPKVAVAEVDGRFRILARARDAVRPIPLWSLDNQACTDHGAVAALPLPAPPSGDATPIGP